MPITMKQLNEIAAERGSESLKQALKELKITNNSLLIPIEEDDLQSNAAVIDEALAFFKQRGKLDKDSFLRIMRAGSGDAEKLQSLVELNREPYPFDGVSPNSFLLMKPKELAAFKEIINGDLKGKKLNQKEVNLIQKYAGQLDDNPAQRKALGDCIRAMMVNDISLTGRVFSGHLDSFLSGVKKEEIESVAKILTALSEAGALDSKSLDYVVKNARKLVAKCDDLATTIGHMNRLDLPRVGFRQEVIGLAALGGDHLANLNGILTSNRKLPLSHFETLLVNIGRLENKASGLQKCIKVMADKGIPLITDSKNRLHSLLRLTPPSRLESVGNVFASLAGQEEEDSFLDERTADYIIKNGPDIADKGEEICAVFNAMRDANIGLEGLRQPVMTRTKEELTILAALFQQMKNPSGSMELQKSLDKDAIKAILSNVAKIREKGVGPEGVRAHAKELGACINLMNAAGLPLTSTFTQDNLGRLLSLNTSELTAIKTIMNNIPKDALDQKTFEYLVAQAPSLSAEFEHPATIGEKTYNSKADLIAEVFLQMQTDHLKGIPIIGNRQPIMNMSPERLGNLVVVLNKLGENPNRLDPDSFKMLISNIGKVKTPEHAEILGRCIANMKGNDIRLSQTLGQNKLERLLSLNETEIKAADKIFASLAEGEALDERSFNFIMEQITDTTLSEAPPKTKGAEFCEKAEAISDLFTTMDGADIELKGHRQDIMRLPQAHLQRLKTLFEQLQPVGLNPLPPASVKAIIANIGNLAEMDNPEEYARQLGKAISSLNNQGIGLTQTLGKGRLARLMEMNTADLESINKLFDSLRDGEGANYLGEDTADYILNQMADPTNGAEFRAKIDDIAAVFTTMNAKDIAIAGHRQPIMNLPKDQLEKLKTVFEQVGQLERDAVKALVQNAPSLKAAPYAEQLGKCIAALSNQEIPLTQTLGENRLARLMSLEANDLQAVATLFDSMKKPPEGEPNSLDERTADFILDQMQNNKANFINNIDGMVGVFNAMHEANIDLKGLRQPVMKMPETDGAATNLNHYALQEVLTTLNQGDPKRNPGLDTASAKALITNIPNLGQKALEEALEKKKEKEKEKEKERISAARAEENGIDPEEVNVDDVELTEEEKREILTENAEVIAQCIDYLQDNQIPLNQTIGSDKIARLIALSPSELVEVANVLEKLNLQSDKGALDDSIVGYLLDNASELSKTVGEDGPTKGDLIVDAFQAMHDAGIDLKGNRRPLMEMAPDKIEELTKLLEAINADNTIKISNDAFKTLRDNMHKFSSTEEQNRSLINCVRTLLDSNIGLTQMFGKDKIAQLIELSPEKLQAAELLLTQLNSTGDLDAKTFDNIMERVDDLATNGKAGLLASTFLLLSDKGISIKGNRQPLMDLTVDQLQRFKTNIETKATITEDLNVKHEMDIAKGAKRTLFEDIRHGITTSLNKGS